METIAERTIGQIVADDHRAAAVFRAFGIDFCCKGNRTLDAVCDNSKLDQNTVQSELDKALFTVEKDDEDYNTWALDKLADHIEQKHHRYVEAKLPELNFYLKKIAAVHGEGHPELIEIAELFSDSAGELAKHMKKEELILFPFVRKMVHAQNGAESLAPAHFGTVENPVQMMMEEHETEGDRFRVMSELSNGYSPPEDACNTYRVAFALLKEFEEDLHTHIHLENNILFPKSKELEAKLLN